jgi:hypothetical protein
MALLATPPFYSTFVTYYLSISYSLVNLYIWIVVIQSGYNILYVVFNTREFHKMSNPIIRREIQLFVFLIPLYFLDNREKWWEYREKSKYFSIIIVPLFTFAGHYRGICML